MIKKEQLMQDFRKLNVWQRGHQLTLLVYKSTATFPKEEIYGLRSQVRRCCTSIPADVAEGCGRGTGAELCHFLQIAMGSASELEYFLLLVHDLKLLTTPTYESLQKELIEIKRMLNALIQKIKRKPNP
jgi:four helix bundle protein